jgi:replicative superfamily II helicase
VSEVLPASNAVAEVADPGAAWFARQGWRPFPFQREVWAAMADGRSGLLHATTGSGKTYAVWFAALGRAGAAGVPLHGAHAPRLGVLWLTPMRALAADSARAMKQPLEDLGMGWSVGIRTGDTPAAERAKQDRRFPTALVTTPESLSLMLTREQARDELSGIHTVIVDEWHELMGSKRGVQVQLALARLRRWNPGLVVWGLSATLGNLADALAVLLGRDETGVLVRGRIEKNLVIDTLLPHNPGRFSWGGHLGKQMQKPVVEEIERSSTTLVFVNMRSQAEVWYQLLLEERPDWAGVVALHHGSLDKEVRDWVELGLKEGRLKAVVATSSLDLGVDFLPVERVLQIGSAKGVARLLQRAGRSGHAPGRASRITLVPTNTLELIEAVAARRAALAGQIEKRSTPDKPFDVLVQHLVTIAVGGGFRAPELFDEVRSTWAFRALARAEFDWALSFVVSGGESLGAYPEYHRVVEVEGAFHVPNTTLARRHKMNVGTIVADAAVSVQYLTGGKIGTVEEGFVAACARATASSSPAHARIRARRRHDGVREARRRRQGGDDLVGRRQDAALERARRLRPRRPRRRRAGRLLRARARGRQAHARDANPALAHPDREDAPARGPAVARGSAPVPLPVRGSQRPHRPGQPAGVAMAKDAPNPSRSRSTTTGSSSLEPRWIDSRASSTRAVRRRRPAARRARQPQLERAGAAALPGDRPRLRAHLDRLPGPAEEHAPAAGVEHAVLRGVPQVRRGEHAAARRRRPRC